MPRLIEIKARCTDASPIRKMLHDRNADFRGVDHQIDTYFKVTHGRLKLREGNIEHKLIHYLRSNQAGPKQSDVLLYEPNPQQNLKALLTAANGILVVVDKHREIYFIDNVKFHIDTVKNLGDFVEIEAIDKDGSISVEQLDAQCNYYLELFQIAQDDLVEVSYSDLLLEKPSSQ